MHGIDLAKTPDDVEVLNAMRASPAAMLVGAKAKIDERDAQLAEQDTNRQSRNHTNSLFVGNPRGGETAEIPSRECRRHGVDPQR
jgi:hypothetical protein